MPFVTEELWQRLPSPRDCKRAESIMISNYPSAVEVSFYSEYLQIFSMSFVYILFYLLFIVFFCMKYHCCNIFIFLSVESVKHDTGMVPSAFKRNFCMETNLMSHIKNTYNKNGSDQLCSTYTNLFLDLTNFCSNYTQLFLHYNDMDCLTCFWY